MRGEVADLPKELVVETMVPAYKYTCDGTATLAFGEGMESSSDTYSHVACVLVAADCASPMCAFQLRGRATFPRCALYPAHALLTAYGILGLSCVARSRGAQFF